MKKGIDSNMSIAHIIFIISATFSLLFMGIFSSATFGQLDELEKPQIPPPKLEKPDINKDFPFQSKKPGVIKMPNFFPTGIDVDSSGNVFVSDRGHEDKAEYRMIKFTNNGGFIKSWGKFGKSNGEFDNPEGVAIDYNTGNVFVADVLNDRVQKFDNNGNFMKNLITMGAYNGWGPTDADVDPSSGNVFVADTENNRISQFTNNGAFIKSGGQAGGGDGKFNRPIGIALDNKGNIFVVDYGNSRVQWFKLVRHCLSGQAQLWDGACFITKWGTEGKGIGQFNNPRGVAVDNGGHVFVSDGLNHRIQKFTIANPCPYRTIQIVIGVCFATMWGSEGTSNGEFWFAAGIAVDDNTGNVFAADTLNNRIQKFTNNGGFISKWYGP